VLAAAALLLAAAQDLDWSERERKIIDSLSPPAAAGPGAAPAPPPSPTNRYADDPAAAALGQRLYFDAGLSPGGAVSCATCHDPEQGWSDGLPLSKGVAETEFNSPTVLNAAFHRWQFWDGRADTLWAQALQPVENPLEMNSSRTFLLHRIQDSPPLAADWAAAFGPLPAELIDRDRFPENACPPPPAPRGPFGEVKTASGDPRHLAWQGMAPEDQELVNRLYADFGKAVAAYERLLVSGPSAFDRYADHLRGQRPPPADFGPAEQRGLRLFVGPASCLDCHFGPMLSDSEFHNVGLADPDQDPAPGGLFGAALAERDGAAPAGGGVPREGRPLGIRKIRVDPFNGLGAYSDAPGWEHNNRLRYLFYDEHTIGAFKTPSLRNVARTAPYGHDGRFPDLRAVLEFYRELPGAPPSGHREETLQKLELDDDQIEDLLAFLAALTGERVAPELRRPPD